MAHLDADQIIEHSMSEDDPNGNAVSDKNANEVVSSPSCCFLFCFFFFEGGEGAEYVHDC